MSRVQKTYTTTLFDKRDAKTGRGGYIAGGLVLAAGVAGLGAIFLTSGPEAPKSAPANDVAISVVDAAAVAADAPVYQLGVGAEGDWRLGRQSRFVLDGSTSKPELEIDASAIQPGRYQYDGDLVIRGDLQQSAVEFTAASVTVTGSINADIVRLIAAEQDAVRQNPNYIDMARGTYTALTGWEAAYARGDLRVDGSVTGRDITMVGGEITISGAVDGSVTLAASGGEVARVVAGQAHGITVEEFNLWRTLEATPENVRELPRAGRVAPDKAIRIFGAIGPDVVLQSTPEWRSAQQIEAPADRPVTGPSAARDDGTNARRPMP
jgi:hypothetical protein